MQKSMKNPERLVGMHFFNPVPKMPLVEIVRGTLTSDAAAGAVFETALKLGKTPILVKDSPGFLVNRVLGPYLNEALHLLMEGAPIDEIDEALLEFGMPMGPMELIDEVGVDVAEKVGRILQSAYGDRMVPAREENPLVPAGRLGKKSGKGLYAYHHGRDKALDANVYAILGVKPQARSVSPTDIVDRCVLPMINEAARCLAEGVVRTPRELDLGMTLGTGFAPFRGGLLRYADTLGAEVIVATLKHLAKTHGKRFLPSPALMDRAMAGQPFHATEVQE